MRFGGKRKEEKLYKQWARHADLPPEAIPKKETPADKGLPLEVIPRKGTYADKSGRGFNLLYILLGVSLLIFIAGLVLLLIESC